MIFGLIQFGGMLQIESYVEYSESGSIWHLNKVMFN